MAKPADKSAAWSKSAINYIQDLALQLYLNKYTLRQNNDATRWGMRNEDKAIAMRDEFLEKYRSGEFFVPPLAPKKNTMAEVCIFFTKY